jgi:hypothetical protein
MERRAATTSCAKSKQTASETSEMFKYAYGKEFDKEP